MPRRAFYPAFQGSGFRLHCLTATATPPFQSGVWPRKIPPWRFLGLQNCEAILHVAKSPLLGLFNFYQVRKSIRGFFRDCKIATQFCMLLSRPSVGSLILFKYEKSPTVKKINFFYAFMSNSKLLPSIYYMEVKTNEIHKQKVQRFSLHRLVRK